MPASRRRRRRPPAALSLLGLAAALALPLSGCYDTPRPKCAFLCGDDMSCPGGYTCRPDGWCKKADVADDFPCSAPTIDASAGRDGSAGGDAAAIDAAAIDAAAAAIDAAPIDAAPIDAAPIDAAPPDAGIDAGP